MDKENKEIAVSNITTLAINDPKIFEKSLSNEKKIRALIVNFINDELIEGIDYGAIHINKDCQNKYNCQIPWHFSKNCLFKSGSEKFISLLKLKPVFSIDNETLSMIPEKVKEIQKGVIVYKCALTLRDTGHIITEGRGACSVAEKGSVNTAIKIALKRAQLDAVLRLGLSDSFTQDLEDMNAAAPVSEDDINKPIKTDNKQNKNQKAKKANNKQAAELQKEIKKYIELIKALNLPNDVISGEIKDPKIDKDFTKWTNINNLKLFYAHLQKLIEVDKAQKAKKENTKTAKQLLIEKLEGIEKELTGLNELYNEDYFIGLKLDMFEEDSSEYLNEAQLKDIIKILDIKLKSEKKKG